MISFILEEYTFKSFKIISIRLLLSNNKLFTQNSFIHGEFNPVDSLWKTLSWQVLYLRSQVLVEVVNKYRHYFLRFIFQDKLYIRSLIQPEYNLL